MTDVNGIINELTGGGEAPPWLSGPLREARQFAYYAKIVALIFAFLCLLGAIGGIIAIAVWGFGAGIVGLGYQIITLFMLVFIALMIQRKIIDAIDQGRANQAKNDMIIWLILGIIFGLFPGVLLLISYMKLGDALSGPQYVAPGQAPPAQYNYQQPPQTAYGGPAPQPQQPPTYPQQAPQPQPAYPETAPQPTPAPTPQPYTPSPQPVQQPALDGSVTCPNCGTQIPPYMHTCPRCGAMRQNQQL